MYSEDGDEMEIEPIRLSFGNYSISNINTSLILDENTKNSRESASTNSKKGLLKTIVDDSTKILFEFDKQDHLQQFSIIHDSLKRIYELYSVLESQLCKWKEMYDELIQKNGKKQYLLSLDSFFFQYKIFVFELEHFRKYIAFLNHRIYGDYYRLYINMMDKHETIENDISLKSHPKHKELEPFFEYTITDICNIHQSVISIIECLHEHFMKTQQKIVKYKNTTAIGYSIFPFLNTLVHENQILKDQNILYENNLHFFYEFQNGFLIDLHSKFKNFEIKLKAHFKVLIGDGENTKNSQLIEMDMSNSIVLAGNIFFQYDNSLENNRYHFSNSQKEPSNIEINTFGLDYDSIMPN